MLLVRASLILSIIWHCQWTRRLGKLTHTERNESGILTVDVFIVVQSVVQSKILLSQNCLISVFVIVRTGLESWARESASWSLIHRICSGFTVKERSRTR